MGRLRTRGVVQYSRQHTRSGWMIPSQHLAGFARSQGARRSTMRADAADAPELNDRGQGASFTYDAFLSYYHQDGAVAAGIQKGLHRIGRRMGQLNALRVFRDS